jgi:hypothetical protein
MAYATASAQSASVMLSFFDHAWRAFSISARPASASGVGAHVALAKVMITSRGSLADRSFRS